VLHSSLLGLVFWRYMAFDEIPMGVIPSGDAALDDSVVISLISIIIAFGNRKQESLGYHAVGLRFAELWHRDGQTDGRHNLYSHSIYTLAA